MTQTLNDCSDILVECLKEKISKGNKVIPFRRLVKNHRFHTVHTFTIKYHCKCNTK